MLERLTNRARKARKLAAVLSAVKLVLLTKGISRRTAILTWHYSEFQIFSESQQSRMSQNIGRYFHCIQLAPKRVKQTKSRTSVSFAFKHRSPQLAISFLRSIPRRKVFTSKMATIPVWTSTTRSNWGWAGLILLTIALSVYKDDSSIGHSVELPFA